MSSESTPLIVRERSTSTTFFVFASTATVMAGILVFLMLTSMSQLVEYNRKMTQNTYLMCNMTKTLTNWAEHEHLQCII